MKTKKYISMAIVIAVSAISIRAADVVANFTLQVAKGNLSIQRTVANTLSITNANPNVAGFTQNIPTNTAGTALTLGDVVTNGIAWFRNLNTNTLYWVDLGVTNGGSVFLPLVRLNANEAWPMRIVPGITPYARSGGTAATNQTLVLEKLIFDN